MRTAARHQRGMTYLGLLILLVTIGFFAMVAIKLVPVYIENYKVRSSLLAIKEEADSGQATVAELKERLLKRFGINDVEHVDKDDIQIDRRGGKTTISIGYEARIPLFYNIDLVAAFPDNSVELGGS